MEVWQIDAPFECVGWLPVPRRFQPGDACAFAIHEPMVTPNHNQKPLRESYDVIHLVVMQRVYDDQPYLCLGLPKDIGLETLRKIRGFRED